MATDAVPALSPRADAPDGSAAPADAQRQAIKRLAQEFEALLMTQMLREMRRSLLDEEQKEPGFGAGTMTDTIDVELGRALSRAGGVGVGDALLGAFDRLATAATDRGNEASVPKADPTALDPAPSGVSPMYAPTVSGLPDVTAPASVSSGFGWRSDPVTGATRFHRGIDLAIAYGQDVKAAAPGRVIFAGRQRGYGNTVVIEHGEGRQTRYAHLSRELVRVGDEVTGGQVLGKSGNSGRTTGPHLHFELLLNGRPIDPRNPEKME